MTFEHRKNLKWTEKTATEESGWVKYNCEVVLQKASRTFVLVSEILFPCTGHGCYNKMSFCVCEIHLVNLACMQVAHIRVHETIYFIVWQIKYV